MLNRIRSEDIGGGTVKFGFRAGTTFLRAGTQLTAEQISKFAPSNRQALIDKGMLAVWPKATENKPQPANVSVDSSPAPEPSGAPAQRHMVHTGRGNYDVIEGRKLNDGPLNKTDAQSLAGVPKDN